MTKQGRHITTNLHIKLRNVLRNTIILEYKLICKRRHAFCHCNNLPITKSKLKYKNSSVNYYSSYS